MSHLRNAFRTRLMPALQIATATAALSLGGPSSWAASRWSPSWDWRIFPTDTLRHAVHMTLLPGDGSPYHSRILWWRAENDLGAQQFLGSQWGWNPSADDGCLNTPTNFTELGVPLPDMDVFCGGQTQLADGRLLVAGGTDRTIGFYGENDARVFTVGAGSDSGAWATVDSMKEFRWYPTLTTLRDGRALVLSGSKYRHQRIFGGKRDGSLPTSPVSDSLYRFAPIPGGALDPAVIPTADAGQKPVARESQSFVEMLDSDANASNIEVLFGGRGTDGTPLDDAWLLKRDVNVTGADYQYKWAKPSITGTPGGRADHSAIVIPGSGNIRNSMIVFGGVDANNQPLSTVFRFFWNDQTAKYQWSLVTTNSGPSARLGHAAIYDASTGQNRMILFGGTEVPGQDPTDNRVWSLTFNQTFTSGTWSVLDTVDLGGPKPGSCYWQSMSPDPYFTTSRNTILGRTGHVAYMYGGKVPNGAYSDTLWALWTFTDGKIGWAMQYPSGTGPGRRARHSGVWDMFQPFESAGRLYIFGGETATGLADRYVYRIDPWGPTPPGASPAWFRWDDLGFSLSGHSAVVEAGAPSGTFARMAEIFSDLPGPDSASWRQHPSSTLLQLYYPPTFLIPGGAGKSRVLTFASDDRDYWLDIPAAGQSAGSWTAHSQIGFRPLTAAMYQPGKILAAGGLFNGLVSGKARTLDASNLANSWLDSGNMYDRYYHNLVLLPDGKVLAVGGKATTAETVSPPTSYVKGPQIWDPSSGTWTTYGSLAQQSNQRGYHSTAILLPDGRVLSSGGEYPMQDIYKGDIFCPPYLFKPDGTPAPRPVVTSAPASLTWGKTFTLCTPDAPTITRACLIRPGATTHSFDQNQRYIPLTFTPATSPTRLLVNTPASPDSAPPGYYLLFVTGKAVGQDNYPDAPSIGRWVRLGDPAGRDTCDAVRPDTVALSVDAVSAHAVYTSWIAPADDGSLAASGPAKSFDLRWWGSPINSESSWNAANQVSDEPTPRDVGSYYQRTFSGLQNCTWYWFANRAWDDNNQLSNLHAEIKAKTTCGGPSPAPVPQSASMVGIARDPIRPQAELATAGNSSGATIIETRRSVSGGWNVLVRPVTESAGLASPDSTGIVMQTPSSAGGWRRRAHFDPAAGENIIGLCALRDGDRAILLGPHALQSAASTLEFGSRPFTLSSAFLSRTGEVLTRVLASDTLSLSPGDSLRLDYEPADSAASASQPWFALFQRLASSTVPQAHSGPGAGVTYQFALGAAHPNPSSGSVSFTFTMAKQGPVSIRIYNVAGRLVRTLVNGTAEPGQHDLIWNAADDGGRHIGAGVYFYRMDAGAWRSQRKVVFLER